MQRSRQSQNRRKGYSTLLGKIQKSIGSSLAMLALFFCLFYTQQTIAQCDITSPPEPVVLTSQLNANGQAGLSADIMNSLGINSAGCPYPFASVYHFYDDMGMFLGSSTFLFGPILIFDCSDVAGSPITIFVTIDDDFVPGGNESSQVELAVTIEDNMDPVVTCPTVPAGSPFSTNYDGMDNDDCRTAVVDMMSSTAMGTDAPSAAIPDNVTGGTSSSIAIAGIPADAAITDIRVVDLGITHTWAGDLVITLTSPTGEELVLMDQPGTVSGLGDSSNSDGADPYDFNDAAAVNAEDMGSTIPGGDVVCRDDGICEYAPGGAPFSFAALIAEIQANGSDPNGSWTLNVADVGAGISGTFDAWSLEIDWSTALTHAIVMDNCPGATLDVNYANAADPLGASIDVMGVTPGAINNYQFYAGTTTVTYTATDASGATATCTFDIMVADDEVPMWDDPVPGLSLTRQAQVINNSVNGNGRRIIDVHLECQDPNFTTDFDFWSSLLEASGPFSGFVPTATDNCASMVTVNLEAQSDISQACGMLDGETNVVRKIDRRFSADDGNGNILDSNAPDNNFILRIYVRDNIAPTYDPAAMGVTIPTALSTTAPTPGPGPLAYSGMDLTVNTGDAFNPNPNACSVDMTAMGAPSMAATPVDCSIGAMGTLSFSVNTTMGTPPATIAGPGNNAAQVYPVGVHEITYTAVDDCGQTSTFVFDLIVNDNVGPVITGCPMNIAMGTDVGVCEATVQWTNPVATDCSGGVTFGAAGTHAGTGATVLIDLNAGPDGMGGILAEGDFPTGTTTVKYTFTDGLGNVDSCKFDVVITDNEAPVLAGCADVTINSVCPNTTVPDYTGAFTLSDNCPGVSATQVPAPGTLLSAVALSNDVAPAGLSDGDQFMITITPTDAQGNMGTGCTITATLMDLDEPIPNQTLINIDTSNTVAAGCGSLLLNAPTATDCNGTLIFGTPSVADGVGGPNQYIYLTGFNFVTWTYDDGNGNTATQSQTITVVDDDIDPVINAGPDRMVNTDPGVCTYSTSINLTETFPTTAPFLDPIDDPGNSEYIDNCGVVTLTYTLTGATTGGPTAVSATPVAFNLGTTTVTYTATDAEGNTGTDQFDITVTDVEAPVPSCPGFVLDISTDPADVTDDDCSFNIGAADTSFDPSATDNCASPPSMTLLTINVLVATPLASHNVLIGATTLAGAVFTADPNLGTGQFQLLWEFDDGNGNTSTCIQFIGVNDDQDPEFVCPDEDAAPGNQATRGVSEDGNPDDCEYIVQGDEFDPTMEFDNCGIASITNDWNGLSTLDGEVFANNFGADATYTITWTIVDINGNVTTCSFDLTITDDVPPTLACLPGSIFTLPPSNTLTIDPNGLVNPFFTDDACSGYPTLTMVPNTFTCTDATNTPIPVTITATDDNGNMSTCNTTVTIQENVLPTPVCQDITIQLDPSGDATIVAADIDGGSTDNCTAAMDLILSASQTSFDCSDVGTQVVTLTVEDASGNTATCDANVTVEDNVDPMAVCQSVIAMLDNSGNATVLAFQFDGGSTDACGISGFQINGQPSLSYTCADIGTLPITLTVFDVNGNSSTCVTSVTVVDNIAPDAVCQDLTLMLDAMGQVVLPAIDLDNGSTDNCSDPGDLIFTIGGASSITLDCDNIGDNTITLEVTDENGQVATCTSTVTVLPNAVVALTAEDVAGGAGAPVIVPVTISNALDVRSLQFTLDVGDASIAEITGGTSTLPNTNINVISTSKIAFSFFDPSNLGVDFMDGDTVLSVEVTLVGMEMEMTTSLFNSSPTPIQVSQGCGIIPFSTAVTTDDGTITIDPNSTVTISGIIATNDGDPVPGVDVEMTGDEAGMTTTNAMGYYEFTVPSGSSVMIEPTSDMTPTQGVTSLDLAIIQAQIVSGGVLNNPYKFIAANPLMPLGGFSAGITSADLALIQDAIVSFSPTFQPFSNSFKFVESTYMFMNPTEPWTEPYPQISTLNNILVDNNAVDFTAIKMGDVNDTWPNLTLVNPDVNRDATPGVTVDNSRLVKGEVTTISFTANNLEDLIAMQAAFQFDTDAIRVIDKKIGELPNFAIENVGTDYIDQGLVSFIWYNDEALNMNQQDLVFSLEVEVLKNVNQLSDVLALTDQLVVPQSYASNTATVGFTLTFEESVVSTNNVDADGFKLLENRPNPFTDITTLGFVLPEYAVVKISLIDASGRLVWADERSFDKGYNELDITSNELGSSHGVFYFQLETADHTAMQKLIRIPN